MLEMPGKFGLSCVRSMSGLSCDRIAYIVGGFGGLIASGCIMLGISGKGKLGFILIKFSFGLSIDVKIFLDCIYFST
jgi:hypothetical protein